MDLSPVRRKNYGAESFHNGGKKVRSIKLLTGSRNVTKKTFQMETGSKAFITVQRNPKAAVKNAAFKFSNPSAVKISKKGQITAVNKGTAQITVTILGKYKKKRLV